MRCGSLIEGTFWRVAHKTVRYALVAISFVPLVIGVCLAADEIYLPRTEVLLFQEFGKIFTVSLDGGKPQEILYGRPHGGVKGLATKPTVIVDSFDEQRRHMFQEVALSGDVIAQYRAPDAATYAVSPDGHQVLYRPYLEYSLWIQDLPSGSKREMWAKDKTGSSYYDLTWSSGGDLIAFVRWSHQGQNEPRLAIQAYFMRVADKQPILVSPSLRTRSPAFSPDTHYIAYWEQKSAAPDSEWELYIQQLASMQNAPLRVKVIGRTKIAPGPICWSPDGQWLLWGERKERGRFLSRKPFFDFYKVRVDGSDLREIPIDRSWWHQMWREIWPPEEKRGDATNVQWWVISARGETVPTENR